MERARLRQLSRTSIALAALFASFPIVGSLLLGEWVFGGATGLAGLFLAAGIYLRIRSGKPRTAPDPAAMLDEGIELARLGDMPRAMRVLNRAIADNPWFWQAFQCRGEVRLAAGDAAGALADFDEALRLAPGEAHLLEWRSRAEAMAREG